MKPLKSNNKNTQDLVNEQLPFGQYLVIDDAGTKLGLFDRNQALAIANDRGFDILVVSPDSKPMVAKILDYSKYRYDQQKKLKEMKKNQKVVEIKEIRLSPTIDKHDFETKLKNAQRFLDGGDKVKVTLRFRGRMITHKDIGLQQVNKFIESLQNVVVEAAPKLEGNTLIGIVAPKKLEERG
ncbi:translation initiation factor IF-3 [Acholeplasma hippikon]|uniref:translation initiation factor IF-3 n=1 Tax=Acholeplasma hippikon TaxID=264636 RepID=UPI000A019A21|nr:translation initiation factor IF-3 [Acholeplasma hippikon]